MSGISGINRYFGLSGSGLDIDLMVGNLMKTQLMKQDKIKQNKTLAEWKRSDYREINNSLRALRDNVFNMKLQGTYLAKKAVSSNEGIVKVSAAVNAVAGSNTIKVTALAGSARLNSGAEVTFNAGGTNLREQLGLTGSEPVVFTLNGGAEISVAPDTDTINNLVDKINNAGAGVTAFFDQTLSRMFISSNATGAGAAIDFDNVSNAAELFGALHLGADPFAAVNGTDAAFELNGTALTQASNQFTIAGVQYTLTGVSAGEAVSVNINRDTDGIYESIKTFVELYNTTIDKVNSKLVEERDKNYLPLTEEQREKLTDDQEKKWEEKARAGLLRNDALLDRIVGRMRSALSSTVPGVSQGYNILTAIGITTGDYNEKGRLHIDENRLKEAIAADPDAVMDLFARSTDADGGQGLATRLYDSVSAGIGQLIDKAGADSSYSSVDASFMGKEITGYEKQIHSWDDRLNILENRYYKQFSALETALSKMNQQSAWLSGLFNGQQ